MQLGTTALKFEEEFFDDVLCLFHHYKVPTDWLLRITAATRSIKSPIDGVLHQRLVFKVHPQSGQTDKDIIHEITLTNRSVIRVVMDFKDLQAFTTKENSVQLVRDAALLESVRLAITEGRLNS